MIGTSVSFLSIVDQDRDFYKSQHGFPEPLASGREMRGRTFCHYAIAHRQPLVIDDTHANATWRAVPTVETFGVRAYLGVPLELDGEVIGSFCVIDLQPRCWTAHQVDVMTEIAKSAERELALRSALLDARQLARQREELLASISHDLRGPLNSILMNMKLIELRSAAATTTLDRVVRAADRMRRMVDDLVSAHAVENQAACRRSIATVALLTDAADAMATMADGAGIKIVVRPTDAGSVLVDHGQLLRVLCNLIGNSIKYCRSGCTVALKAVETASFVELIVADDGPGMTLPQQARAFERDGKARRDSRERVAQGLDSRSSES